MRFKLETYDPFEWHKCLIIFPVITVCKTLVFFEYVERRALACYPHAVFEYRLMNKDG